MMLEKQVTVALLMLFCPLTVHAYIGPGMGLGAIGIVLGILGAIVLAFFAILWYPFKRLWNRRVKKKEEKKPEDSENEEKDSV